MMAGIEFALPLADLAHRLANAAGARSGRTGGCDLATNFGDPTLEVFEGAVGLLFRGRVILRDPAIHGVEALHELRDRQGGGIGRRFGKRQCVLDGGLRPDIGRGRLDLERLRGRGRLGLLGRDRRHRPEPLHRGLAGGFRRGVRGRFAHGIGRDDGGDPGLDGNAGPARHVARGAEDVGIETVEIDGGGTCHRLT
jgi:hypothetical protein